MAEDYADKTEAPTPKRRQEAREQGNIARSPDIVSAALLITVIMMLGWTGPSLVQALKSLLTESLSSQVMGDIGSHDLFRMFVTPARSIAIALVPLLGAVMLVAIAANLAQVGFFLNFKRLTPNINALSPIKGWGRLFGGGNGWMQLLLNALKVFMVALVAYSAIQSRIHSIIFSQRLEFIQIFGLGAQVIYAIALRVGLLLLVLAIIDYVWQRYRIDKQLRMTKQEVKEEMKRMEGDPQIKQRRRQVQMQRATQRARMAVPTADVIVTNPTHFAVALKYDGDAMHAPRVVAKGQDLLAMRIREIAVAHGIPIVERKPLARALYRMCDVGQEIPEQFYSAVAEILAYVYELSGKLRKQKVPA